MDYLSLGSLIVSVFSLSVAIFSFRRAARKDQFALAFELNNRMERSSYELAQIHSKIRDNNNSEKEINTLRKEKKLKSIEYLNNCEFLSFLINNNEITNRNIRNYFMLQFENIVKMILEDYGNFLNDKEQYKEIKRLFDNWKIDYSFSNNYNNEKG